MTDIRLVILAYILGHLVVGIIIFWLTLRCAKSKKTVVLVALLLILYPFKRYLLFQGLFFYYSLSPLQEIGQTVELPISVYWEDNVWPGFDEYGRNWMIDNYLDGVHLKLLCLNDGDGRIYCYRAGAGDFAVSNVLKQRIEEQARRMEELRLKTVAHFRRTGKHIEGAWDTITKDLEPPLVADRKEYARVKGEAVRKITAQAEVYNSASDLPPMRYKVAFNPVELTFYERKLLHADEIVITDERNKETIAFSRRYMAYAGWFARLNSNFDYKLGDERAYEFDDKVLFGYAGVRSSYDFDRSDLRR